MLPGAAAPAAPLSVPRSQALQVGVLVGSQVSAKGAPRLFRPRPDHPSAAHRRGREEEIPLMSLTELPDASRCRRPRRRRPRQPGCRRSRPRDVDELRSQVHGPVYAAGDDGMAAEVATWNVAVQHTPAIAVGATCAADVAAAVSWAVAHDLRVAVQATGHGPVRNAAGSLMITTRRMQGLSIDPERRDRPRRGRRQVEPGPRGRRRVRARRAVRLVVRRRRRRLHPRRRHGLAGPQARLRGRPRAAPSRSSPPTAGCAGSAPTPSPSCSGPSAAARATSAS